MSESERRSTGERLAQLSSSMSLRSVFLFRFVVPMPGEKLTENDVVEYEKLLHGRQTMPLPEYKRVSVAMIRIGKDHKKRAVEHIFFMKGNIEGKLRVITFAHNGNGFTFTCATSVDRFEKANQQFFTPLFDSMDFK